MATTDETSSASPITRASRSSGRTRPGRTPVVFIHGLWLLPSSWDRWAAVFEEAGYIAADARLARRSRDRRGGQRAPRGLRRQDASARSPTTPRRSSASSTTKPAVIGHSFGGLLTQILAGRGLSAASVAIDPAPFRGVLPLPISALKSGSPVLGNPANRNRAVPLTYEQFRYAFANAVSEDEAKELYDDVRRAGAGRAAVPGGDRQPQPVDRGEGRHARTPTAGRC